MGDPSIFYVKDTKLPDSVINLVFTIFCAFFHPSKILVVLLYIYLIFIIFLVFLNANIFIFLC